MARMQTVVHSALDIQKKEDQRIVPEIQEWFTGKPT
jgi:hypothetical protein